MLAPAVGRWVLVFALLACSRVIRADAAIDPGEFDRLVNAILAGDVRTIRHATPIQHELLLAVVKTLNGREVLGTFNLLDLACCPVGSVAVFDAVLESIRHDAQLVRRAWTLASSQFGVSVQGDPAPFVGSASQVEERQLQKLRTLYAVDPRIPLDRNHALGTLTLMNASRADWVRVVRFLARVGVEPRRARDDNGNSALHEAKTARMVDLLVELGISANIRGDGGQRPLEMQTSRQCLRALVRHGARLDMVDDQGLTPLMDAYFGERPACVQNLLALGADLTEISALTNKSGTDKLWGHRRILRYLVGTLPRPKLLKAFLSLDGDGLTPAESWIADYIGHHQGGHKHPGYDRTWESTIEELQLLKERRLPLHRPGHRWHDLAGELHDAGFEDEARQLRAAGIT